LTSDQLTLYRRIGFAFTARPLTMWAGHDLTRVCFKWIKLRKDKNNKHANRFDTQVG
jgi:hypothetical protein